MVYHVTLKALIQSAWHVRDVQVVGSPGWIDFGPGKGFLPLQAVGKPLVASVRRASLQHPGGR